MLINLFCDMTCDRDVEISQISISPMYIFIGVLHVFFIISNFKFFVVDATILYF